MDSNFNITEKSDGRVVVVDIPKRLTSDTSDDLKTILKNLVEDKKHNIVINLEKTAYMDSSGLGSVVSKIAATRANKGDIRLAAVQKYVADLLDLTHIDQILQIYDSVDDAVRSFEE